MPTAKMCQDTVTLYNYIGEVDLQATYSVTILENVYVTYGESVSVSGLATKTAYVSIYDQCVTATSIYGDEKTCVTRAEWQEAEDKSGLWTVDGAFAGRDFIVLGKCVYETPPEGPKIRLSYGEYCGKGSDMTRHWQVEGT